MLPQDAPPRYPENTDAPPILMNGRAVLIRLNDAIRPTVLGRSTSRGRGVSRVPRGLTSRPSPLYLSQI